MQEFVAAFEDLDEKHGYANDKYGSGGGGEAEGPVAAAVGHDAVLKWQGSREHRGQLSRSLTARGSTTWVRSILQGIFKMKLHAKMLLIK